MKKQVRPPKNLEMREPLQVFVERIGDKSVKVRGDMSKRTLRELLMSSLMVIHPPRGVGLDKLDLKSKALDKSEAEKLASEIRARTSLSIIDSRDKALRERFHRRTHSKTESTDDYESSRSSYYEDGVRKKGRMRDEEEEEEEVCATPSSLTEDVELSFDGKWLRRYTKVPLKHAIKEILAKKPYDPVGYLGFWLLNYRNCQEHKQRALEDDQDLHHSRLLVISEEEKEEYLSVENDEMEDEIPDWNFKHYDIKI